MLHKAADVTRDDSFDACKLASNRYPRCSMLFQLYELFCNPIDHQHGFACGTCACYADSAGAEHLGVHRS
jgi:hypothetical protein